MKSRFHVNFGNLLLALSDISDIANPLIAQHQQRTAFIALRIARIAGIDLTKTKDIFTAALLHDIGALSVEEKLAIHNFEEINPDLHCICGEVLLKDTPCFKKIAPMVRNHHAPWNCQVRTESVVFGSQVLYLADLVERLVQRDRYILHQHHDIIEKVVRLTKDQLPQHVIDFFLEAVKREEFWLDLVSPRLNMILHWENPYQKTEIDLEGISAISGLYRDVIDFKSDFTAVHTAGVSACAVKMGELFKLTPTEIKMLKIAGNLHDIGKFAIPNSILEKPGPLTTEEFAVMKSHTYYTYYAIKAFGGLEKIAQWAGYHHEKLDGSGYPFHRSGSQIDDGARIIMVADIFTAVSEDRPYRRGMAQDEIYRLLRNQSDAKRIDQRMVDLLFDNYQEINRYVRDAQACAKKFYEERILSVKCQNELQ